MRLVSLKIIITAHSTAPDDVREVQNHGGSSDKCAAIVQLTIYIHGIFDETEEKNPYLNIAAMSLIVERIHQQHFISYKIYKL